VCLRRYRALHSVRPWWKTLASFFSPETWAQVWEQAELARLMIGGGGEPGMWQSLRLWLRYQVITAGKPRLPRSGLAASM